MGSASFGGGMKDGQWKLRFIRWRDEGRPKEVTLRPSLSVLNSLRVEESCEQLLCFSRRE